MWVWVTACFNSIDTQWFVQADPVWRAADVVGDAAVNEVAASISSNVFVNRTDTMYLTNDTDVIYSKFAAILFNNLAVNVSLTDPLALRTCRRHAITIRLTPTSLTEKTPLA